MLRPLANARVCEAQGSGELVEGAVGLGAGRAGGCRASAVIWQWMPCTVYRVRCTANDNRSLLVSGQWWWLTTVHCG